MPRRLELTTAIGNTLPSAEEDIINTRKVFNRIEEESGGDESFVLFDKKLDTTIRKFQKDNDLKQDGIMQPGGETERAVNKAINAPAPKPERKPLPPYPKKKPLPYRNQDDSIRKIYPELDIIAGGIGKGGKIALATGKFLKDTLIEQGGKQLFKKIVDKANNKDKDKSKNE